ncbi:hypothetical protein NC653_022827 [Populus alba x Populus x berolinensis]|uniref:Major facilitator superfamily (MFS) profile domain-containing protein n=1 Tax=Populus alba x Populus x berolinensis TaxID=444605 RepID=A0AAD6MFM0_9ROSI|nr:hypothetical protein NC653_022814 [Populus alba x Populus x berolinensis]KAJ6984649.1 hypothetical protein NC653_022827 [Populus alba x Populus x berolinensis]
MRSEVISWFSCNPVFFQSLGFGAGTSLYSSIITRGALVVGALSSMGLVALAVTLALEFGQGETLSKATSVFLVVIICLFCFAYGRSWGPLGWLVPCELFPLETWSAGRSIVVCLNMIFTALIAQCSLVSLCHLRYGIFLLFAALGAFMGSFIFFLLPETKQVSIEEETQGICVAAYKTNEFPVFFTERSGYETPQRTVFILPLFHPQPHPYENEKNFDLNSSLDIALVKNNALAGDKIAVALLRSRNILIEVMLSGRHALKTGFTWQPIILRVGNL